MSSSPIFRRIAALQRGLPWGRVLDAGTGVHSLRWVSGLQTEAWTAVTASEGMARQVRTAVRRAMRTQDRIVEGDWTDPGLLAGETFDTVLADYLLGAVDGFAPYFQSRLFERLRPLVGRRLYVVGLQPYVPGFPQDEAGRMVVEMGRARDACLLLAGERTYREYPLDWVLRALAQAGFRVIGHDRFPIRYGRTYIDAQIDMCEARLPRLVDAGLAASMQAYLHALRERAHALHDRLGGLAHGFDYVAAAEPLPLPPSDACVQQKDQVCNLL
ncbi:class I SAM-dependent methyltransferase [Verticiella sediminum]|uniref:Class I SAM-dependent methyltransferase n=1 Tax=Verticiella sediminum TaxID=1247510 RepID=A0A556AFC2_9BURK|nr:class I SAM-dependent methyltransferase [Verticiella sediminum]TSH91592.1 class I SAM-dependent methyltransferase [Verticiella sediminum]